MDSLNEYHQNTMTIKVLLLKLKNKEKELRDKMKYRDVEDEQINTELISQKEEPKEHAEDF